MVNIKDIRHDLIDLIMQISSSEALMPVYDSLDKVNSVKKANIDDAVVELLPLPSLEEIAESQKTTQLIFSDMRKKSKNVDWEFTLDEMLNGLN